MDSNLSRLYFMLGNFDDDETLDVPLEDPSVLASKPRKKAKPKPSASAESDTLLLNGSNVPAQVVVVDLPPPKARTQSHALDLSAPSAVISQLDSPPAATLDISSSTTIFNPHASHSAHILPNVRCPKMAPKRQSRTNSIDNDHVINQQQQQANLAKQPSVELHFNPLYTISDGGVERHQHSSSTPRVGHSDSHSSPSVLPNLTFRFPSQPSQQQQTYNQHLLLFGHPPPPTDRYGLVYVALLLAGIGFLLPYNSFVIASDYFQHRFPSTTIVFDMSTTYIVVAFCTVLISNAVVEFIPLFWRLNLGYLLSLSIMAIVAVYEIWAKLGGYLPNLVLIGIAAVGCTLQQSTFYGYTSMLPKKYTQAVMTGESAAGIFVSLNRIITKILYPADEQFNTALFFFISILVIILCAFIHIVVLPRSDFIRHYILLCNNHTAVQADLLHHRTRRRRSKSSDSEAGNAARVMHQINENLGLVQMYNQRSQQHEEQALSVNAGRPSIYSTGSQMHLDAMIEAHPGGYQPRSHSTNSNNNVKVQSILRTDSMECVMPFGIDDEELAVEERQQLQEEQHMSHRVNDGISALHSVPQLNHQDSMGGAESPAGDFKTKSATSMMVVMLAWFENFTNLFRVIGIFCRRLRQCSQSFTPTAHSLRKKYYIRKSIIIRIWPHICSIMLVYFVTLIIFPGIESEIYSCYFHEWMPIILMACFNLTDFIGKLLSTFFYRITGFQLLFVAVLRCLLIPAMTLCVTPRLDPFFANPVWPIFFTIVLGLTNGIFGSLPMILAPIRVHENMREITGNLMTFSYIIGLTSGSFSSYYLHDWINLHSPQLSANYSYSTFADNCSDFFNPFPEETFDRNALLESLGNGTFLNATELLKGVAPELLQNSTVFSKSIYHF